MLQGIYDLSTGYWGVFVIYWIIVFAIMTIRQIGALIFHIAFRFEKIFDFPAQPQLGATIFVTIFDEDIDLVKKGLDMTRRSFDEHCSDVHVIATIDGADINQEYAATMIEAISPMVDLIYTTNVRSKRQNLRNMMARAKELDILHDISCFMDSDTMPDNTDIARELLRPFADPEIGGVTTCQRIYNANSVSRIIADWIEFARIYSSMAAGSLIGQVGCLPGRLYAVRSEIVQDKMDDLVEDYWSVVPFTKKKVQCFAGDDRVITNFVLKAGYKTVMMPSAGVKTCMPRSFLKMFKQWERWGRSSQGYTLRTLDWSWKQPWILFQNLSDIFLTLGTVYILTIHWVLIYFVYPPRPEGQSLPVSTSLMFFFFGAMLTIFIRQGFFLATQIAKHKKPWIVFLVPVFFLSVSVLHFIRVYSLLTPQKIGVWGTRAGADDDSAEDVYVRRVYASTTVSVDEETGELSAARQKSYVSTEPPMIPQLRLKLSIKSQEEKVEDSTLDIKNPATHPPLLPGYVNKTPVEAIASTHPVSAPGFGYDNFLRFLTMIPAAATAPRKSTTAEKMIQEVSDENDSSDDDGTFKTFSVQESILQETPQA